MNNQAILNKVIFVKDSNGRLTGITTVGDQLKNKYSINNGNSRFITKTSIGAKSSKGGCKSCKRR
jgi:hypothetical protein